MNDDKTAANAGSTGRPAKAAPLFYSRVEALNPERHGSLSLAARSDFSFARSAYAIPVVAAEMPSVMRSYPIVFIGPIKAPVIITGLRNGENLFIDADGGWARPHHIPAYVRRYPFLLAEDTGPSANGRLTLCVDRSSDRVVDQLLAPFRPDGDKVVPFFEGTQPTEATKQALAFCGQFQIDFNATRAMIEKIDAHGLFAPRQSKITLDSGETFNLTDFQVIDEAAFNALGDDDFLDLRKSGALSLIYCHLASTNSWTSLIHQASVRKAADGAK